LKSIIYVCLGNICRSPLAEEISKKYCEKFDVDIEVDSAGTGDWHVGEAPCENSIIVAKKHGIEISHLRAKQVSKADLEYFDLVVAFDDNNYRDLELLGAKKLVKLGDFGYDGKDIPDPYFFSGYDGFEEVYTIINKCVLNIIEQEFK
jgi:protein-tyrosine phosphatase